VIWTEFRGKSGQNPRKKRRKLAVRDSNGEIHFSDSAQNFDLKHFSASSSRCFSVFSRAKNEISQLAVKTRKEVSEPKYDGGKRLRTSDYPKGFPGFVKNQLLFRGEVVGTQGWGGGSLPTQW
jgi:hypothetical protein